MKVFGQLEMAQLEQIASTGPNPRPTGRVYADVTNPLAALPMFYDGTSWKQLAFQTAASNAIVSQNSGKAVTVNWSTSLNQKVVLTDNCVISFSNPQEGQLHRLEVVQRAATNGFGLETPYSFTFNMTDQDSGPFPYQPERVVPVSKTKIFQWFYNANAVAAITTMDGYISLGAAPATAITGMDISPDGTGLMVGRSSTPFQMFYQIDPTPTTPNSTPLGLQNAITPTATAGTVLDFAYHPNGNFLLTANATSPFIQGYFTSGNIPLGTAIANPGTLPTGAGRCVDIHPTGLFVVIGHATSPFMSAYPFTGAAYGTKLSDPGSLPAAQVNGIAWSKQGDYLAVASQTTPFLEVYPFTISSPTSGSIGVKLAAPGTLPAGGPAGGNGKCLAWRPQGDYIAMAMSVSPFLYVVPFNRTTGAFGTPLTVTTVPPGALTGLAWSPCGTFLFYSTLTSPYFGCYDFSSFLLNTTITGFGSLANALNTLAINRNGTFVYLGTNTTVINGVYAPQRAKNYLRLT